MVRNYKLLLLAGSENRLKRSTGAPVIHTLIHPWRKLITQYVDLFHKKGNLQVKCEDEEHSGLEYLLQRLLSDVLCSEFNWHPTLICIKQPSKDP